MVDEQITSISNIFTNLKKPISQLYLSNNQIKGAQFSIILNSLKEKPIKSIIYGHKNEFNMKSFEMLRDTYLCRTLPDQLQELRLIDVKIRD